MYDRFTYIGESDMASPLRTQRTEARLLPEQKKRIERAADIKGVSVSEFLVQNADDAAIRTIEQYESWTLATRDRNLFVEALLKPAEPSAPESCGPALSRAGAGVSEVQRRIQDRGARSSARSNRLFLRRCGAARFARFGNQIVVSTCLKRLAGGQSSEALCGCRANYASTQT